MQNFILINVFISLVAGGIVLVSIGYKLNRNPKLLIPGWIINALTSIILTIAFVYLGLNSGIGVILLFFLTPLIILGGIVATAAVGVSNLISGYTKKNPGLIAGGWTCLIINTIIVTSLLLLLILFNTGAIRISFM